MLYSGLRTLYGCVFVYMPNRSIIYIDGYNFYYGAVYQTRFKWLNFQTLFQTLRQDDSIQKIYYFTALLDNDPVRLARQNAYLEAMRTCNLMEIVLGKYKSKEITCRVHRCTHQIRQFQTYEEKRTDVNIALQMLADAYENKCDRFIVISGDSDLVPVINRVKRKFPNKKVTVYVPHRDPIRGAAVEIRNAADKHKSFPLNLIPLHQFPVQVPDGMGGFIQKPPTW